MVRQSLQVIRDHLLTYRAGFDTGNIGGVLTLPAFKHAFGFQHLTADEADGRKGDIAAMRKLLKFLSIEDDIMVI